MLSRAAGFGCFWFLVVPIILWTVEESLGQLDGRFRAGDDCEGNNPKSGEGNNFAPHRVPPPRPHGPNNRSPWFPHNRPRGEEGGRRGVLRRENVEKRNVLRQDEREEEDDTALITSTTTTTTELPPTTPAPKIAEKFPTPPEGNMRPPPPHREHRGPPQPPPPHHHQPPPGENWRRDEHWGPSQQQQQRPMNDLPPNGAPVQHPFRPEGGPAPQQSFFHHGALPPRSEGNERQRFFQAQPQPQPSGQLRSAGPSPDGETSLESREQPLQQQVDRRQPSKSTRGDESPAQRQRSHMSQSSQEEKSTNSLSSPLDSQLESANSALLLKLLQDPIASSKLKKLLTLSLLADEQPSQQQKFKGDEPSRSQYRNSQRDHGIETQEVRANSFNANRPSPSQVNTGRNKCSAQQSKCAKTCEFFPKLDANGCETCECCSLVLFDACNLDCERGFKADKYGCPLCACVEA